MSRRPDESRSLNRLRKQVPISGARQESMVPTLSPAIPVQPTSASASTSLVSFNDRDAGASERPSHVGSNDDPYEASVAGAVVLSHASRPNWVTSLARSRFSAVTCSHSRRLHTRSLCDVQQSDFTPSAMNARDTTGRKAPLLAREAARAVIDDSLLPGDDSLLPGQGRRCRMFCARSSDFRRPFGCEAILVKGRPDSLRGAWRTMGRLIGPKALRTLEKLTASESLPRVWLPHIGRRLSGLDPPVGSSVSHAAPRQPAETSGHPSTRDHATAR